MNRPKNFKSIFFLFAVVAVCSCGGKSSDTGGAVSVASSIPRAADDLFFKEISPQGTAVKYGYLKPNNNYIESIGGGVAAGDYDRDGDIDIFIVRGDIGPNLLYRNEGNNTFTEVAIQAGVAFTKSVNENYRGIGPMFADLDGDGYPELFIGGIEGDPVRLYKNNQNGTFTDITEAAGLANIKAENTISAAVGDYDLDGDLDLMLSHWGSVRMLQSDGTRGDTEHLWKNISDANGIKFVSASQESQISKTVIAGKGYLENNEKSKNSDYSFSPAFVRLNEDLYPDIIQTADFANTRVFINNAEPSFTTFKDVTADSSFNDKNAMGLAVGDIDNDGKQDFFMTGIWGIGETIGNKLIKNNGGGKFTDISFSAGIFDGSWGWGACMADFNLDGYLDIFNVNGWSNDGWNNYDSDLSRLFINLKNGTFKESSAKAGMYDATQGRGIVCADFDNDGDVDILVTHRGYVNAVTLWRNDMTGQNSLKVKLIGHGLNSEAVGARITIEMGGQKQMREIMINSNFISQNPTLQVFGLGKADHVDMISVEWPDGKVEHHANVLAGSVSYSWE